MFEDLKGKSAAEVFWLNLMNTRIRRQFLKNKQKEEVECLQKPNFNEYYDCVCDSREDMESYMNSMQFYQRKFEKCIYEGIELAKYK